MALTQIYPGTEFPALPGTDITLGNFISYLQRIEASLRPVEQHSLRVRNADNLRLRYEPAPTSKSAVRSAIQTLTAATSTGLTAKQVQDLLATMQAVKD